MEHLTVTVAQQCVLESIKSLGTESVRLEHSLGRVLAEDIVSPCNVPNHDNSAMDGYAFRFAEWVEGQTLAIAGTALAGQPFTGDIPVGACLRIMTGAQVPARLDTVIMQEHTAQTSEGVLFTQPPKSQANIRLETYFFCTV